MTPEQLKEMNNIRWWHRIELEPNLYTPGEVRHGPDGGNWPTTRFGIPKDLSGKSVLDIGGWDGFFSFECEKRGAKVVLADIPVEEGGNWGATKGFQFAKKVLNSQVEFRNRNVNVLNPQEDGMFDITLQYGVLYHLPDIFQSFKATRSVTKEMTLLETAIYPKDQDPDQTKAHAVFMQGYNNDPTNYWYPNIECVKQMMKAAGYREVECIYSCNYRATFRGLV